MFDCVSLVMYVGRSLGVQFCMFSSFVRSLCMSFVISVARNVFMYARISLCLSYVFRSFRYLYISVCSFVR